MEEKTGNIINVALTEKDIRTLSDCILAQMTQLSQSMCGFPQF